MNQKSIIYRLIYYRLSKNNNSKANVFKNKKTKLKIYNYSECKCVPGAFCINYLNTL